MHHLQLIFLHAIMHMYINKGCCNSPFTFHLTLLKLLRMSLIVLHCCPTLFAVVINVIFDSFNVTADVIIITPLMIYQSTLANFLNRAFNEEDGITCLPEPSLQLMDT